VIGAVQQAVAVEDEQQRWGRRHRLRLLSLRDGGRKETPRRPVALGVSMCLLPGRLLGRDDERGQPPFRGPVRGCLTKSAGRQSGPPRLRPGCTTNVDGRVRPIATGSFAREDRPPVTIK